MLQDQTKEGGGDPPVFQPLNRVQCVAFADNAERKRNMKYAFSLKLPRIQTMVRQQSEHIAIVAGGPSLNKTYKKIFRFNNIMSCGSAHDHVLKLGIKPTFHIDCDPALNHIDNYKVKAHKDLIYLIASRCHRSLFKKLKDRNVRLWHMWEAEIGKPAYKSEPAFVCGATVVLAAIPISLSLGFKHMHFFGFDSSFEDEQNHHAYPQEEKAQKVIAKVGDPINGKAFHSTATWLGQAQQFEEMQNHWGFKATIYGDSLMAEMQKERERLQETQRAKAVIANQEIAA